MDSADKPALPLKQYQDDNADPSDEIPNTSKTHRNEVVDHLPSHCTLKIVMFSFLHFLTYYLISSLLLRNNCGKKFFFDPGW